MVFLGQRLQYRAMAAMNKLTGMTAVNDSSADVSQQAAALIDKIRARRPLVHCITNFVTMNDCANVLLAAGASPAMIMSADEAFDFAQKADALYVNLGTLVEEQERAIMRAVLGATAAGTPIVIDPVACAAVPRRAAFVRRIAAAAPVAVVKGNMAEIAALADAGVAATPDVAATSGGACVAATGAGADAVECAAKGVDSSGDVAGIEHAAANVARQYNCVVAATGKRDVVADGERIVRLCNGTELLTRISGGGCMAGALCAAAAAVVAATTAGATSGENSGAAALMAAAVAGVSVLSIAGELAAQKAALPGSFHTALFDAVSTITGQVFLDNVKLITMS
jgi:hydroxyethylthiazole kinase